jgi:hypothetical protein
MSTLAATPPRVIRAEAFAAGAILCIAAVLRLHDLAGQSLWWDEVMSYRQARLPIPDLLAVTAEDNYPPLHNLILHAAIALLGSSETALRLPSALLGLADIAAVLWVGTLLGGRRAGVIAAALLAVSGFHLWYSGEARMYALLSCAATVYAGTAARLLIRPSAPWGVLSVLAGTALIYSHPYGAFAFFGIAGSATLILILRRAGPAVLLAFAVPQLLPPLLLLPWFALAAGRLGTLATGQFWAPPVTAWTLVQMLVQLLSGPFMLAAVAVGIRLSLKGPRPDSSAALPRREALVLAAGWAAAPLVLGTVASLLLAPMLIARYLLPMLPPLLILAGIGIARFRTPLPWAAIGIAALTGLFVYAPPPRDDFRGIAAALPPQLRPGDCLVMIPEAEFALRHYWPDPPCLKSARRFAEIAFDSPPGRILLLATMDADLPGLAALGTPVAEQRFGPTRVVTLVPLTPAAPAP